jgi:putative colanic acid biosynthesis acetyltransferase WcaF
MISRTRLDKFNPRLGLDRGRSKCIEASWYILKCLFISSAIPWPYTIKILLLRLYGAQVGHGLVIKPRVNIHFPWKLVLADHVWIGEEVFILNLEPITVGAHTCISQRVFLCTGNHDFRDPSFSYRNSPIFIGSGAWIGAAAVIGPGVKIGEDAVISMGTVVSTDVPRNSVLSGNPAKLKGKRWRDREDMNQRD